jgi:3-hydroxyisobutyrate dehydrogenase-like beta-hydroxyacid dehydrogenase
MKSSAVVGFVGLGAMGSRMVRRLLNAGHELVVWNRTPEKAAGFAALGARVAEEPADLPRGSTSSGTGKPEAESGSLKIFVGGPGAIYDRWTPLLGELGSVLHAGPLGAGAAAKLVANTTLFGVLGALGEALALARALGLSPQKAFEVLAETPLAAQAERRRPSIESGEYPPRFALPLARKDVGLILDAAGEGGAELRLISAMRTWLEQAEAAGWGDRDYSSVLNFIINEATEQ